MTISVKITNLDQRINHGICIEETTNLNGNSRVYQIVGPNQSAIVSLYDNKQFVITEFIDEKLVDNSAVDSIDCQCDNDCGC